MTDDAAPTPTLTQTFGRRRATTLIRDDETLTVRERKGGNETTRAFAIGEIDANVMEFASGRFNARRFFSLLTLVVIAVSVALLGIYFWRYPQTLDTVATELVILLLVAALLGGFCLWLLFASGPWRALLLFSSRTGELLHALDGRHPDAATVDDFLAPVLAQARDRHECLFDRQRDAARKYLLVRALRRTRHASADGAPGKAELLRRYLADEPIDGLPFETMTGESLRHPLAAHEVRVGWSRRVFTLYPDRLVAESSAPTRRVKRFLYILGLPETPDRKVAGFTTSQVAVLLFFALPALLGAAELYGHGHGAWAILAVGAYALAWTGCWLFNRRRPERIFLDVSGPFRVAMPDDGSENFRNEFGLARRNLAAWVRVLDEARLHDDPDSFHELRAQGILSDDELQTILAREAELAERHDAPVRA